ncbi:hypothetical protein [Streptomyces sp. 142MFCol3.1]|uniref:hypothetical protein n=1 Tax=Streptomyces sp. 142MFCol3.1 TaxID=1172179 RepID=UPI000400C5D6|nr:hypothetical protein [Streptomyces sp. 142MFCol3.1]
MPGQNEVASRKACIDAWADAILAHPDDWSPGEEATPEECPGQFGSDWADLYIAGQQKAEERRLAAPPIDDGASLTASPTGQR